MSSMLGNVFQFDFGKVMDTASKFGQQKSILEQGQTIVKNLGPQVQSAWIGGDEDEFVADIARRLVPRYAAFIAALAGMQVNLGKASDQSSSTDKQAMGLVNGLGDQWKGVLQGL